LPTPWECPCAIPCSVNKLAYYKTILYFNTRED